MKYYFRNSRVQLDRAYNCNPIIQTGVSTSRSCAMTRSNWSFTSLKHTTQRLWTCYEDVIPLWRVSLLHSRLKWRHLSLNLGETRGSSYIATSIASNFRRVRSQLWNLNLYEGRRPATSKYAIKVSSPFHTPLYSTWSDNGRAGQRETHTPTPPVPLTMASYFTALETSFHTQQVLYSLWQMTGSSSHIGFSPGSWLPVRMAHV